MNLARILALVLRYLMNKNGSGLQIATLPTRNVTTPPEILAYARRRSGSLSSNQRENGKTSYAKKIKNK